MIGGEGALALGGLAAALVPQCLPHAAPWFVATPLMANVDPDMMKSAYPLDFFPVPDDYTGPYLYLASADSRVTTGTLIEADLGMTARGIRKIQS